MTTSSTRYKNIEEYGLYLKKMGEETSRDQRAILVFSIMLQAYKDKLPAYMFPDIIMLFAERYDLSAQELITISRMLIADINFNRRIQLMAKNLVALDINMDNVSVNDNLKASYDTSSSN